MKHLILLRHAKSSWVNPELDDFDRPLNKRGRRSAKAIGNWLRDQGWRPDLLLCSSARRARETWEGLGLEAAASEMRDDLYQASAETMLAVLKSSPPEAGSVLMIGHNPGISEFGGMLVANAPDHPRFSDFPTGGLLIADFEIKKFARIAPHSGIVRSFLTPHDLVQNSD